MSQFLAPIHTWLFNKILVMETIEKNLVKNTSPSDKEKHEALQQTFGEYIPSESIENLIDPSNIHGWLQGQINSAETRQAAFVGHLLEGNDSVLEGIKNSYFQTGVKVATDAGLSAETPAEAYKALGDVLLEGMPCDRVNSVSEETDKNIAWKTVHCVHKNNWESNGVDVAIYYLLRESFSRGFIETLNPIFSYSYSNEEMQVHEIKINE